jgi:hypothetical protein
MRTAASVMARRRALACIAGLALPLQSRAQALQAPAGAVVLSIGGRVQRTNQGERAALDMAMLEALAQRSFTTKTPWFKQPRKFTGPLLREVLAAAGAKGSVLRAVALNDYWVEIPFEDAARHDVIIARLLDDKPMAVRDKGPLFVIYPFDTRPELRSSVYFSRTAWQLRTIEVR